MPFRSQDVDEDTAQLVRMSEGLGRTSLVAAHAAERLIRASRSTAFLTPAELYQYVDPAAVERSFDQEQSRAVQRLLLVRNLLFILPVILTFAALGLALILYQADVTSHPQDASQSFLLLWESGFNTGNALFAASTIAVLDAGLFLVGGVVGVLVGLQRLRGRKQKQAFLEALEENLERLANRSLTRLGDLANPNANQSQALFQVNQALQESVKITQNVQVQIVQVVQQMGVFQESTASLSQNTKQVGQYLGDLGQNLVRLSEESTASARRLEAAQDRAAETLTTLVTRISGNSDILTRLAQEITDTFGKLEDRLNQAIQVISVTGPNLVDRTANYFNNIERAFTSGVAQIAQQTDQLVTAIQMARTSTQQLTEATGSLAVNQQVANQIIQAMLQRLNEIIRETGGSAAALASLVDTEADTMRVASSLVTRLELIQQLLGRLVALAGTGTRGDPFLQGLLGSEQEQQSLGINPLRILSLLEESGTQPKQVLMRQVQKLMGQMPLDPAVFSDIITTFSDMDLVTLSGKSGDEQVKLTTLGRQVIGTLVSP